MKVVLQQHVENVGDRGQVVNVARGFARNYLLPKGLALEATPGNLKVVEQRKRVSAAREAREVEDARAFAARLAATEITVAKKAGDSETLYGSVTSSEIAELLEAKGIEVDRRKIQLDEPIKALGSFSIPIRLHRQVTGEIKVTVVAEGE